MWKRDVKTEKFDMDDKKDLARYNEILSNDLCSVISEKKEKLTTKHFDDEGKPSYQEDKMILVVTWMEKTPL